MTSTTVRSPLNGVDVPTLFGTLDAVRAQPQLAAFQFRATNEWVSGTHSRGCAASSSSRRHAASAGGRPSPTRSTG